MANYTSSHTGAQIDSAISKVLDTTATAAELNTLDGITASTAELNFVDGVTSNIQTQLNGKQATLTFNTAYNASTNKAATMADITAAVGNAIGGSY